MQRSSSPQSQNRLLASLSRPGFQRLAPYLEPVVLSFGEVLHEAGQKIEHVYFPYSGVVSLLGVVGASRLPRATEVAVVGKEGVVGGTAAHGIDTASLRSVVQVTGSAARISAARMYKEFKTHGSWNPELFHFNHGLMEQVTQSAVCNRFHRVEARLARWLLATRDRSGSNHVHVTQEFLANMLGVRRVGITAAATHLQQLGLIAYSRGNLQMLDPAGLEAAACECYPALKAMYWRSARRPASQAGRLAVPLSVDKASAQ